MFLVRVILKRSPIHGLGVFAAEPIPAGAPIWTFTPEIDRRLEQANEHERVHAFQELDGSFVLCGDAAKYVNHASDPNLDDTGDVSIARRAILVGEELTSDYWSFDRDAMFKLRSVE